MTNSKNSKKIFNTERDAESLVIVRKRTIIIIAAVIMFLGIVWFINNNIYLSEMPSESEIPLARADNEPEYRSDAFAVVRAMGAGWNLGNTLDSIDNHKRGIASDLRDNIPAVIFYETYWGNPVTTREMITSVAEAGFGAIRIPVTWADHLDENYNIRLEWLERVEQVVNYVLDNDIYCIINLHHDTGSGPWPWLRADMNNIEWMEEKLAAVWTQIAEHFKDYGEKLLFESFNEILDINSSWGNPDRESSEAVNKLNQVFVDTVRGTGARNSERYLVVKTYSAGVSSSMLNTFAIPDDSAESRLIVGVHYYGVLPFTWRQKEVSWADAYSDWSYTRDGFPVESIMKRLGDSFVDKGIPVIISEFGAMNKNNTADRINYVTHYVETAKQYEITCFWWDSGGQASRAEAVKNMALFDRYRNRWFFPKVAEAIINASR